MAARSTAGSWVPRRAVTIDRTQGSGVLTACPASSTVSFAESFEQHHHHPILQHVGSPIVCSNVSAESQGNGRVEVRGGAMLGVRSHASIPGHAVRSPRGGAVRLPASGTGKSMRSRCRGSLPYTQAGTTNCPPAPSTRSGCRMPSTPFPPSRPTVTLREVADAVGISPSAVSMALADHPRISRGDEGRRARRGRQARLRGELGRAGRCGPGGRTRSRSWYRTPGSTYSATPTSCSCSSGSRPPPTTTTRC